MKIKKSKLIEMIRIELEGFKSDAQRRAAFASGYKAKGKKKKNNESVNEGKMNLSFLKIQTKNLATDVQDLFIAVKGGDEDEITSELDQVKFRIGMLRKKGMGLRESINETLPNRVWMDLRKKYSTNELKRFFKKESVNEGGMGVLSKDQADILQGLVMKHKNKNPKAIYNVVMKSPHFKGVDKKEMLGYIHGAIAFSKYMKI
jgi:hypothetical protein